MRDYRRNRVPGGTFFFTVNRRDRPFGSVGDANRHIAQRGSPGARPHALPQRASRRHLVAAA